MNSKNKDGLQVIERSLNKRLKFINDLKLRNGGSLSNIDILEIGSINKDFQKLNEYKNQNGLKVKKNKLLNELYEYAGFCVRNNAFYNIPNILTLIAKSVAEEIKLNE